MLPPGLAKQKPCLPKPIRRAGRAALFAALAALPLLLAHLGLWLLHVAACCQDGSLFSLIKVLAKMACSFAHAGLLDVLSLTRLPVARATQRRWLETPCLLHSKTVIDDCGAPNNRLRWVVYYPWVSTPEERRVCERRVCWLRSMSGTAQARPSMLFLPS